MSKTAEPFVRVEALAKLAELRLAQGRLEEAARLLDGIEDHTATTYLTAALHLGRRELGRPRRSSAGAFARWAKRRWSR